MSSVSFNSFYLASSPPDSDILIRDDNTVSPIRIHDQSLFLVLSRNAVRLDSPKFSRVLSSNPFGVLIKILSLSTNFRDRGDLELRLLNPSINKYFVGSDFVGEVVYKGPSVDTMSVGDIVIPSHTYPEYGLASVTASAGILFVDARRLIVVPSGISHSVAASFSVPYQTAYSLVRRSGIRDSPDAHALITAPRSATSLAVMDLLRSFSIPFTVCLRSESVKTSLPAFVTSDIVVANPSSESFASDLSVGLSNRRITHVFDNFPDVYAFHLCPLLEHSCVYMFAGLLDQGVLFQDRPSFSLAFAQVLHRFMMKNIRFIGNCLGTRSDISSALSLLSDSRLSPVIDSVFPFESAEAFITQSFVSRDRVGKAVLDINPA